MIPTALPARSNRLRISATCSLLCSAHKEQRNNVMPAGVAGGPAVEGDVDPDHRHDDVERRHVRRTARRAEEAEIDARQTSQANECMLEHALNSTRRARFNASSSAPDVQKGTVYFLFLPQ
jgi:hypothetical protein